MYYKYAKSCPLKQASETSKQNPWKIPKRVIFLVKLIILNNL